MPRPKATATDLKKRKELAKSFKEFRRDYYFSQVKLAERLNISRRTVQQIEAGDVTPHAETVRAYIAFKKKHEREASRGYS